jgi:hypothetical protein
MKNFKKDFPVTPVILATDRIQRVDYMTVYRPMHF